MIRTIVQEDIFWLASLARKFNAEYFDVPLNDDKLYTGLSDLIDRGVCLRSDSGAIVGVVMDDPFRDWQVLVELGWYCEDRSGLHLLNKFIQAGKDLGVDEVRMTTLTRSPAEAAAILNRKGFVPIETSHSLTIGE